MRRSALTLAALATAAIPGLDVVATRAPQHDGSDFAVTGVLDSGGRRWVVRCPQHAAAGAALEGEVALLERLAVAIDAGLLPFEVPRPAGFANLPEGGRAVVYRELGGRALDLAELTPGRQLAKRLGQALAALHRLPPDEVEAAGLPVYDAEAWRLRRLAELDNAARTGDVPAVLLERWERALEDVSLWRFQPTPVHGDLAPEHVLVSGGELTGVLDWAHAQVGDPAEDLAWLFAAAPEDALESVLEEYFRARGTSGDANLAARATLASELALARWLLHGVRIGDVGIVDEARRMLTDLAELVRDAPPIAPEPAAPPVIEPLVPRVAPSAGAPAERPPGEAPEHGLRSVGAGDPIADLAEEVTDAIGLPVDTRPENPPDPELTVEIPPEERPTP